jgi:chromosome segregation ATPase
MDEQTYLKFIGDLDTFQKATDDYKKLAKDYDELMREVVNLRNENNDYKKSIEEIEKLKKENERYLWLFESSFGIINGMNETYKNRQGSGSHSPSKKR